MKNNLVKRILTELMCILLIFSSMPTTAFASAIAGSEDEILEEAASNDEQRPDQEEGSGATDESPGDDFAKEPLHAI
ncbi:MAG: hypothetical protein J6I56_04360 [Lachnospiraceae bacterium]|nr:hypothetical protein [Lachnospiraceae bacterium]